jgi:putative SOS response-associated peptidase YedK
MCGGISNDYTWQELNEMASGTFGLAAPDGPDGPGELAPRLDIRPSQTVTVLRNAPGGGPGGGYEWAAMRWGFDVDWMKRILINAKAESLTGRFWSEARPAILFASGFYEWPLKQNGKKPANYRRYLFTLRDRPVMMLAAVWRPWPTRKGDTVDCMAVCTTAPNPLMAKLPHHRMAAVLDEETAVPWLRAAPRDRAALIPPYPSQLMQGQGVSDPKNDDPATLVPVGEPLVA